MGSMESLSSHSSEQNSSAKAAPCSSAAATTTARPLDDRSLWDGPSRSATAASSCVSSPESSSREDAGRTDGESEDALSVSSLVGRALLTPRSSPAPKKAPHCHIDLRLESVNRSAAHSLKSLQLSEGRRSFCDGQVSLRLDLGSNYKLDQDWVNRSLVSLLLLYLFVFTAGCIYTK